MHFPAICASCERLCEHEGIKPDELYVWIDYSSIPQLNTHTKRMSIGSLAVYSSVCKYFVCVAPSTEGHAARIFDESSYSKRGWCRLEQWARMTVGGLDGMFVYGTSGTLENLNSTPW